MLSAEIVAAKSENLTKYNWLSIRDGKVTDIDIN